MPHEFDIVCLGGGVAIELACGAGTGVDFVPGIRLVEDLEVVATDGATPFD